jgi:hypothetical protein
MRSPLDSCSCWVKNPLYEASPATLGSASPSMPSCSRRMVLAGAARSPVEETRRKNSRSRTAWRRAMAMQLRFIAGSLILSGKNGCLSYTLSPAVPSAQRSTPIQSKSFWDVCLAQRLGSCPILRANRRICSGGQALAYKLILLAWRRIISYSQLIGIVARAHPNSQLSRKSDRASSRGQSADRFAIFSIALKTAAAFAATARRLCAGDRPGPSACTCVICMRPKPARDPIANSKAAYPDLEATTPWETRSAQLPKNSAPARPEGPAATIILRRRSVQP